MELMKLSESQKHAMDRLAGPAVDEWQTAHEMQVGKDVLNSLIEAGLAECSKDKYQLTEEGTERRFNRWMTEYRERERLERAEENE